MNTAARALLLARTIGLVLVAAACTTPTPAPTMSVSPPPATAPPVSVAALENVDCPSEVTDVMVLVPSCIYVTVPERHSMRESRHIRIMVVRIDPADGVTAADPMVVVGETLGGELEYGGVATLAQRTGRVVYLVDRRGTGQSEPNLHCPEVHNASEQALRFRVDDPAAVDPLLQAVRDCRDRLTGEGWDVGAYGLGESALDVEAIRRALEIPTWNIIGFGTASRLAVAVADVAASGAVRSVVLDSPLMPSAPDPMFAHVATAKSVAGLAATCAADTTCASQHPDVAAEIRDAIDALATEPLVLAADEGSAVVIDGIRFARSIRQMLAVNGGRQISEVLPAVDAALSGSLATEDVAVSRLSDGDLCIGYVPECTHVVYGSLFTTVCGDTLPFSADADAAAREDDADPLALIYDSNPFHSVCEIWDVPAADANTNLAPQWSIPTLAMTGEFDPYTGPVSEIERAATGLSNAMFLEVPNQSYNVFGYNECPRLVRRAWLQELSAELDTSCFAEIPALSASR